MSDVSSLNQRIDAAFEFQEGKIKKLQEEWVQAHHEREKRMAKLGQVFEELTSLWRPRLDLLMQKFGNRVQVKPRIIPATREVTFEFQSQIARIKLQLSASTDLEVTKVVLEYDLEIIPALMQFEKHAAIEFPLDAVDKEAAAQWVDDRIVSFVRTYLSLHENDFYIRDHMVEDPIAKVRFPKFAAKTTLEVGGQTYYFIGEETKQQFAKQSTGSGK